MAHKKHRRGEKVRVQVGDIEVSLRLPQGGGAALPSEEWLPFSPTEKRIVLLLLGKGAQSREQIALALDESVDGRIKGILATLVARKVLRTATDGYEVNAPDGRRKALKGWFTEPGEREKNEEE